MASYGNTPEFRARKGDGPMDGDELEGVVRIAIEDALQYVDDELGPDRAKATKYYKGEPFGNEEEGRSNYVSTDVRDNILGAIPSILRIVHGPEHVVEYVPKKADAVEGAAQATDYARYIYEEDNNGFEVTHSVLKDALLKKMGVVKWGMSEEQEVHSIRYRGLSREQMGMLAQEPNAEIVSAVQVGEDAFDAEVSRVEPVGKIWVLPIPPDDFFWNRAARSLDDTLLVGHRARMTHAELRALGVSDELLEEYGDYVDDSSQTLEEIARRTNQTSGFEQDPDMGEANRRTLYCEAYMMVDMQGNGLTELRRLCTLGNTHKLIKNDPAPVRPFAVYRPDPEPHAFLGGSWYDLLKDIQKINSQLFRGTMDSLSISLFPRTAYVEGQASVADILNTAIGAPIRMRQPGMVQSFEQPFTGEKVLPILSLMRDITEQRVGQRDGAGSLDMDALQSTGAKAADAAIMAAQSTVELLARLFAEQFMKPLFKGILALIAHPKSKDRLVRLRGTYVPVSPAGWDANMDVSVNVALGTMNTDKKIAVLNQVVTDQQSILEQLGPQNPMVTLAMVRNSKAKILSLNGIKDVDSYYMPVPADWQPPPPPPPEPTEDDKWREAEAKMSFEKNMKELAIKQDELALKTREFEHKEAQAVVDNQFRQKEIALDEEESVRKLTEGPHNADIERYKADITRINAEAQIASSERLAAERNLLELRKIELDAEVRRYEAELQAQTAVATFKTGAAE